MTQSSDADADFCIRPYRETDLVRLQDIRAAAFAPIFASFRALTGEAIARTAFATADAEQARQLEEACAGTGSGQVWVAACAEAIIGFVTIRLDRSSRIGEIGINAIHPLYSGKGYGTRMYEFALGLMRHEGMVVATVSTGGDDSHAPARRAYASAGFAAAIPAVTLYRLVGEWP